MPLSRGGQTFEYPGEDLVVDSERKAASDALNHE
jgi:hypothetical protein